MLLAISSQNFIGMGWKMSELHIIIFTWVIFNCAGALCKKTYSFNKIYKKLIIKKSPNLGQNCVKLFLILQNSKGGLSIRTLGIIKTFWSLPPQKWLCNGFQMVETALPKVWHNLKWPMSIWLYVPHSFFIPSQWNCGPRPLIT